MSFHLPENCPRIPIADWQRIQDLSRILEAQSRIPSETWYKWLQAVYMIGYLQAETEVAVQIRQQLDTAILVMRK